MAGIISLVIIIDPEKIARDLAGFSLDPVVKQRKTNLHNCGFRLEVIPKDGNFRKYIRYVIKNKDFLQAELEFVKRVLETGDSWGEILIVTNKDNQVIASFGPNRIEEESGGKRAMPGYFFVLPPWRGLGIGTVLWNIGVERMKKMGAGFIRCSVERSNIPALKIYRQMGMKSNF